MHQVNPNKDTPDIAVVDLRALLDRVIDSAQVAEALERTCLVLLSRAAEEEATRRRMSTTLRGFYDAHGDAPDELVRGQQRGHGLDAAGPSQVQWSPSASPGFGGVDRAAALRAVTPEVVVPSWLVELAGRAQFRRRCQSWSLKFASWPCTSICGWTT
jgi:hypothetical protein